MSIWQWQPYLPTVPSEHQLTLGEGNTPLIASRRLGPAAGLPGLHFKLELTNPTGSFKDRFAASAISHMRAAGESLCVATSSGNTGSALAAYCAAADIRCRVAIVETAPQGKLFQMLAYGPELYRVDRFGIDPDITARTFDALRSAAAAPRAALQISAFKYSPLGMAGVETISFEIAAQCEGVTDVFVPAGGGGLTLAVARGFQQLVARGQLAACPRVHCVQPVGNDTIAGPLRAGAARATDVDCTSTISGLQVPSVIDGDEVIAACRATGGTGYTVTDEDIYRMQQRLAREEGIFCEPAAAVSVAGAMAALATAGIGPHSVIVCLVTGSGFKDFDSIERMVQGQTCPKIAWTELASIMRR
jgi:threonine synthase